MKCTLDDETRSRLPPSKIGKNELTTSRLVEASLFSYSSEQVDESCSQQESI